MIKCLEDIYKNTWVVPAVRLIREIAALFPEDTPRSGGLRRSDAWRQLTRKYDIKKLMLDSFLGYSIKCREVGLLCSFLVSSFCVVFQ
jgi:hypothetical protein